MKSLFEKMRANRDKALAVKKKHGRLAYTRVSSEEYWKAQKQQSERQRQFVQTLDRFGGY